MTIVETPAPPLRMVARNMFMAVASFVIVTIALVYVLAPGGSSEVLTVRENNTAQAADEWRLPVTAPFHQGRDTCSTRGKEVVYGTVSAKHGIQVKHVTLQFQSVQAHGRTLDCGQVAVGGTGPYRTSVHLATGTYRVIMQMNADGRRLQQTSTVHVVAGRAYDVSANVRNSRIFSFLPVTSY